MMDASKGTLIAERKSIGTLSSWLISRKLFPNSVSRHFCGYKARHFTILSAPTQETVAQDPAITAGVPTSLLKHITASISLLLVRSPKNSTLKDRFTGTRRIQNIETWHVMRY